MRIDDAENMLPARHHAGNASRAFAGHGDRGGGSRGTAGVLVSSVQLTQYPKLPHAAVPRAISDSPWVIVGEPNRSDARLLCRAGAAWPRASAD